jgi:hypothetical protein
LSVFRTPPANAARSAPPAAAASPIVVAEVTKNLSMKSDPACLFIDLSTPEGKATGVLVDFSRLQLGA